MGVPRSIVDSSWRNSPFSAHRYVLFYRDDDGGVEMDVAAIGTAIFEAALARVAGWDFWPLHLSLSLFLCDPKCTVS